ncbi:hypothetical protein HYH03_011351 [Edaphochlamys debaryana]|uniref:DNA 3'-5' helicase n=1 Tax=Edaphochlamys debaryana TaxID=47281 RepID=A0A836BV37_9CHLO|nr:hypothetical protein HYH03_011351 [Edaphochlamys debaryana]|eukprot:KAG2490226.1 hypothetical protein HYH03_011351 [Edaphochlamys debaryana]
MANGLLVHCHGRGAAPTPAPTLDATPSAPTPAPTPAPAAVNPTEPHLNSAERFGLNEEQTEAALTEKRIVRVKAGPGSGKTRLVVARAHHLITARGVPLERILCITFTNKAANELKERLTAAGCGGEGGGGEAAGPGPGSTASASTGRGAGAGAGAGSGAVVAKTFHGLGVYILRQALRRAPGTLPVDHRFKIVDSDKSEKLLLRAVFEVDAAQQAQHEEAARAAQAAGRPPPRPLPPLTSAAAGGLLGRMKELVPHLKSQLAAKGLHVRGTELRVAAAEGLSLLGTAPPAQPQLPARTGGDKGGDSAGFSARWHRDQAQLYLDAYERLLAANNALDFSDLIAAPVRLLDCLPDLAEAWKGRFAHLLVDEFQDTDGAQYRLVKQLLGPGPGCGLFVVGDPDQAIYSWRGAQVHHMATWLPEDFPDTQTFLLSSNYRSLPEIVGAAEALLTLDSPPDLYRPLQPLRSSPRAAEKDSAPKRPPTIAFLKHADEREEANDVARRIQTWIANGRLGPKGERRLSEVAVLYRNRDLSRVVEEAFNNAGIPFTVVGGQPFWERKEVADTVAFLHVASDPVRCDVFLDRVFNVPKRGMGDAAFDKLKAAASAAGLTLGGLLFSDCLAPPPLSEQQQAKPFDGSSTGCADFAPAIPAGSPLAGVKMTSTVTKGVQALRGLVCRLRAAALDGGRVAEVALAAVQLSGYEADLQEQARQGKGKPSKTSNKKTQEEEVLERLDHIQELIGVAAAPDSWISDDSAADSDLDPDLQQDGSTEAERADVARGRGLPGLARFLEHTALVTGHDTELSGEKSAVRLMTLHSAKGLEFERVFIIGLEDGILPSAWSAKDPAQRAEETRLLYVGVTRAKDRLLLSRCERRFRFGEFKAMQPSPLLRQLQAAIRGGQQGPTPRGGGGGTGAAGGRSGRAPPPPPGRAPRR